LKREAVNRIPDVVPGQLLDPLQSIGNRADGDMQPFGRFGGNAAGVEIGLQGLQQRLRTAAGRVDGAQHAVHEIDDGGLVAQQYTVDQQVMSGHDRGSDG
jgi:hypothetical protein